MLKKWVESFIFIVAIVVISALALDATPVEVTRKDTICRAIIFPNIKHDIMEWQFGARQFDVIKLDFRVQIYFRSRVRARYKCLNAMLSQAE